MSRSISYDRAAELLRQPDHKLMKGFTDTKRGKEFFITGKGGGPVTDRVAKQLLDRPDCREIDDGLFPGVPQTYSLWPLWQPA